MTAYHHIQGLPRKIRFTNPDSSVSERIGGRGDLGEKELAFLNRKYLQLNIVDLYISV